MTKKDNKTTKNTKKITIKDLQSQLLDAQQSSKDSYEKLLRSQAEMENLKRRNAKDIESAHKFALEKFSKNLLEVSDSLTMGIKTANDDKTTIKDMKTGIEMTNKIFLNILTKFGVEQINPIDEKLDPEKHQAVTMLPGTDKETNTIIEVVQIGFSLNNRLIRPAMVIVAA